MVTIERVKAGLWDFVQRDMMPKLDSKRQFLMGMALGVIGSKADAFGKALAENSLVKMLGIVQPNGEIDIDTLYNAAYAQMQAQGKLDIDIPMMGRFSFSESDLRELYNSIIGR